MAEGTFCAEAARVAGEGIAGSAVEETWRWVLLEVREPWPDKVYEKAMSLSHSARARLDAALALPGARFQAIRRSDRREGPLALYVGSSAVGASWLRRVELSELDALAELDLEAMLASGPEANFGEAVEAPLLLVCTHGKRDRCCALYGVAFYRALRDADEEGVEVWQCSHLGGHRFAATALTLPAGHGYGWLEPDQAADLARATAAGQLFDLEHHRGRCAYPRPVQAAEAAALARDEAWSVTGWASEGEAWRVELSRGAGERQTLRVQEQTLESERPKSCEKAPTPASRWRIEGWGG